MSDDRKTLDQRNQMTDLERLRHSAAHVLATAILRIWPEAQFAAGPPVENGFYYDVEFAASHFARGFRADRGGDEEGDQGNHVFEKTIVSREKQSHSAESGRLADSASGRAMLRNSRSAISRTSRGRTDLAFPQRRFPDLCADRT
jgi:threonyl-tRNA synthetase